MDRFVIVAAGALDRDADSAVTVSFAFCWVEVLITLYVCFVCRRGPHEPVRQGPIVDRDAKCL